MGPERSPKHKERSVRTLTMMEIRLFTVLSRKARENPIGIKDLYRILYNKDAQNGRDLGKLYLLVCRARKKNGWDSIYTMDEEGYMLGPKSSVLLESIEFSAPVPGTGRSTDDPRPV